MLLLTRVRWPQPIALVHWGQGRIDPNISRMQFYSPSCKQRFLLADLGLDTESSTPPPQDILCCTTEPRQKSGAILAFTRRFGREDFIKTKNVLNILERAWT
jgi:hypothetical protein